MITKVFVPFLGVNDAETHLRAWEVERGKPVTSGSNLCVLETTKATIEVQADTDGLFYPVVEEGKIVKVGQIIGFITDEGGFDVSAHMAAELRTEPLNTTTTPTKKAELLMVKHSLDPATILKFANGDRITEQVVLDYIAKENLIHRRIGVGVGTKVGIIGGVSGGGALIIADAISRINGLHGAAIYDKESRFHDRFILGIPVLGSIGRLQSDINDGRVDAVVIAFNRDLNERHKTFLELLQAGVKFVNVIDQTADIRNITDIGIGNVILGHSYVGPGSTIGDNNFCSANVFLEHGNVVGSSCSFGPGVFTSGNVSIGDRVKFGTGIFVEPSVTIGDDSIIGSGRTIVTDIKSRTRLLSAVKA